MTLPVKQEDKYKKRTDLNCYRGKKLERNKVSNDHRQIDTQVEVLVHADGSVVPVDDLVEEKRLGTLLEPVGSVQRCQP